MTVRLQIQAIIWETQIAVTDRVHFKSFVIGICTAFGVIAAIGMFNYIRGENSVKPKDSLLEVLEKNVSQHEKEAGLGCQSVQLGIRDLMVNVVKPLLESYGSGADWKINFEAQVRRTNAINGLLEACTRRQVHLMERGAKIANPISQELIWEFGSMHAFLAIGLKADTCGSSCIASQMSLIEAKRIAILKLLAQ